jgi:hypothetical protein
MNIWVCKSASALDIGSATDTFCEFLPPIYQHLAEDHLGMASDSCTCILFHIINYFGFTLFASVPDDCCRKLLSVLGEIANLDVI